MNLKVNQDLLLMAQSIAEAVDDVYNYEGQRVGYGVILFEFDKGDAPVQGNLCWISNTQRSQMAVALRELAARLESVDLQEGHC